MKFTSRESTLAIVTLTAVLAAITYFVGKPKWDNYSDNRFIAEKLERQITRSEKKIADRPVIMNRLETLKSLLPVHPSTKDVKSQLSQQVEQLASQARLTLKSLEPDDQRELGDLGLYEMSITCDYEGNLMSLVNFLHDLQGQGAVWDIRQMIVKTDKRSPGNLKGSFIIDCAYSRTAVVETPTTTIDAGGLTVTPISN